MISINIDLQHKIKLRSVISARASEHHHGDCGQVDDNGGPDRSVAAVHLGGDETDHQGGGEDGVEAVHEGEDQGAAHDPDERTVA